jgi:hypothetical protein
MQLHISPIRRTPNQLLEPTRLRRAAVLFKFDFMEQFFMFATLRQRWLIPVSLGLWSVASK